MSTFNYVSNISVRINAAGTLILFNIHNKTKKIKKMSFNPRGAKINANERGDNLIFCQWRNMKEWRENAKLYAE